VRARVPASTSNIGPGFDVLGLALSLYTEVEIAPADALSITATGDGAALSADPDHLAARVVRAVLGHDRVEITIRSEIPIGRGLGSSAALALAAAAAAGAPDPLAVAAAFDGHGENAAASARGGLVAARMIDGAVVARPLALDDRIGIVAIVPDRELRTANARSVLPQTVPFADAVFNLGGLGLLIAGLADVDGLVAAAGADRLHQDARTTLFPEAPALLEALRAAGAVISCWSGAGPTLLGLCRSAAAAASTAEACGGALARFGLTGRVLTLEPDRTGLVITGS
jgi:homoserine kinase